MADEGLLHIKGWEWWWCMFSEQSGQREEEKFKPVNLQLFIMEQICRDSRINDRAWKQFKLTFTKITMQ